MEFQTIVEKQKNNIQETQKGTLPAEYADIKAKTVLFCLAVMVCANRIYNNYTQERPILQARDWFDK